jgi:hypothetical protein
MNGYGKQTVKQGARNISTGISWIVVAHSGLIFAVSVRGCRADPSFNRNCAVGWIRQNKNRAVASAVFGAPLGSLQGVIDA